MIKGNASKCKGVVPNCPVDERRQDERLACLIGDPDYDYRRRRENSYGWSPTL
jgi:hypothetical protein